MKREGRFLGAFFLVLFFSFLLLILSGFGLFRDISGFFQKRIAQVSGISYHLFQKLPFVSADERVKKLEDENLKLQGKLSEMYRLKKENEALLDQFQTSSPKSYVLLPARVLAAPGFIPGVSAPAYFILDKGSNDSVQKGQAVLIKDTLVGQVTETSKVSSKVNLLINPSFSITVKTSGNALGILTNKRGEMILDNVVLSDTLEANDLVYTKGEGAFIVPDLIVGKILSVEKDPSALFQKAKLKSPVNPTTLSTVFIWIGEKE